MAEDDSASPPPPLRPPPGRFFILISLRGDRDTATHPLPQQWLFLCVVLDKEHFSRTPIPPPTAVVYKTSAVYTRPHAFLVSSDWSIFLVFKALKICLSFVRVAWNLERYHFRKVTAVQLDFGAVPIRIDLDR